MDSKSIFTINDYQTKLEVLKRYMNHWVEDYAEGLLEEQESKKMSDDDRLLYRFYFALHPASPLPPFWKFWKASPEYLHIGLRHIEQIKKPYAQQINHAVELMPFCFTDMGREVNNATIEYLQSMCSWDIKNFADDFGIMQIISGGNAKGGIC